jgi:hypothetical protein
MIICVTQISLNSNTLAPVVTNRDKRERLFHFIAVIKENRYHFVDHKSPCFEFFLLAA